MLEILPIFPIYLAHEFCLNCKNEIVTGIFCVPARFQLVQAVIILEAVEILRFGHFFLLFTFRWYLKLTFHKLFSLICSRNNSYFSCLFSSRRVFTLQNKKVIGDFTYPIGFVNVLSGSSNYVRGCGSKDLANCFLYVPVASQNSNITSCLQKPYL